jgi:Zn-finger nucleic acid-binding protein
VTANCPVCDVEFTPRNRRQRCCSSICNGKLYYRENSNRILAARSKRCANAKYYYANKDRLMAAQRLYRRRKAAEQLSPD